MITNDITAPYSAFEAWAYDFVAGRAVNSMVLEGENGRVRELPRGGRVLDVGCGGGQNALDIAALRVDLEVVGLDLASGQVQRARRRAASFGERVRFVQGSASNLPFRDEDFDCVVSIASIKHWPDRRRGLSECVRVLERGGSLLVVEADRGCRLEEARRLVERFRLPRLLRPFALAGFRTWVAGRGLDLDEARELLEGLPLERTKAARVPGAPALILEGVRAG